MLRSLRTAVDLLELGAQVGFGGLEGPRGQQVLLLQQVDWPQGLHLQLRHPAQPPQGRGQLGHARERLQGRRGTLLIVTHLIVNRLTFSSEKEEKKPKEGRKVS